MFEKVTVYFNYSYIFIVSGIEKKSSKAVKEFVVICDGPSTVPIFHFRLEEWQLSREALLNKETRNKIRKSIKGKFYVFRAHVFQIVD